MNKKNILKINLLSLFLVASCTNPTTVPVGSSSPTPTSSPSSNNVTPSQSPDSQSSVSPGASNSPTTPSASASAGTSVNTGTAFSIPADFLKLSYNDYYSAELKWTQMTGAKSYKIYQDGKLIADNLTGSIYNVKNLTPNTNYSFDIIAVNDAGESNKSTLKVRTFIPSSNSSSNYNNNYDGNNGYYSNPIPTLTPTPTPVPTSTPIPNQNLRKIYVNQALTTGANDGTSWANAYTNLQTALTTEKGPADIWIAKGTYYTAESNNTDRLATFNIPDGISVYGGFVGTESKLEDRITNKDKQFVNETILSGDFQRTDDDIVARSFNSSSFRVKAQITDPNPTNNSYHVVTISNEGTPSRINGLTIRDGYADERSDTYYFGGAIYIGEDYEGSIEISNSSFINNTALIGGAISTDNDYTGDLTIIDSIFDSNSALDTDSYQNNGGAIYARQDGNLNIIGSTFKNSTSGDDGGSVYVGIEGDTNITNSTFQENKSVSEGGAIRNVSDGKFTVTGSTFEKNTCGETGGALSFSDNTAIVNISSSIFNNNKASENGGAIYLPTYIDSSITGSTFTSNTAINGGAIFIENNNDGDDPGMNIDVKTTLTSTSFTSNSASSIGGAIYLRNSALSINNITFTNNTANNQGKKIFYTNNSTLTPTPNNDPDIVQSCEC